MGQLLIFKIYLSGANQPAQHIELKEKEFTHYLAEEEILLSPFFTYQVVNVEISKSKKRCKFKVEGNNKEVLSKITMITLVEVPY
jgi:hypothetical protein